MSQEMRLSRHTHVCNAIATEILARFAIGVHFVTHTLRRLQRRAPTYLLLGFPTARLQGQESAKINRHMTTDGGHFHDRVRDHAASALDPAHHPAAGHVAVAADVPSRPARADLNLKIVAHHCVDPAHDRLQDLAAGKNGNLMVTVTESFE
ncbi:hypothetical protein G9C98_007140 [Cotesia typhae]|uniref:Uncharacterized protein n=1 Tax=Cotesia typhae TaxID=2053667 RepID=A0A8J5V1C8_9HYME|nr:hypothetical protein G9C98_007140 [Cotesia typhae]